MPYRFSEFESKYRCLPSGGRLKSEGPKVAPVPSCSVSDCSSVNEPSVAFPAVDVHEPRSAVPDHEELIRLRNELNRCHITNGDPAGRYKRSIHAVAVEPGNRRLSAQSISFKGIQIARIVSDGDETMPLRIDQMRGISANVVGAMAGGGGTTTPPPAPPAPPPQACMSGRSNPRASSRQRICGLREVRRAPL
jgi:hypothetical protein